MNIEKILLAVDGSDHSLHAAGHAADLAKCAGAEILLFTCYPILEGDDQPFFDHSTPQAMEAEARKTLEPYKVLLAERGAAFTALIASGDPAREIVATAKAGGSDVIVMGSRGLGKVMGLILGSVTKDVVQTAPCSVWVVR